QREKASFLTENFEPIQKSGRLNFLYEETDFTDNISYRFYNGHTEGLLVPFINYRDHTIVYVSDLFPTAAHIPSSWVCGFDIQPLISMQEHAAFLKEAADNGYVLFFEHDIFSECCTVKRTEKGIRVDKTFSLKELTN
ncbi:MAG: hypothetical protein PVF73_13340, partial [Bacteroidales bacterium]